MENKKITSRLESLSFIVKVLSLSPSMCLVRRKEGKKKEGKEGKERTKERRVMKKERKARV